MAACSFRVGMWLSIGTLDIRHRIGNAGSIGFATIMTTTTGYLSLTSSSRWTLAVSIERFLTYAHDEFETYQAELTPFSLSSTYRAI